MTNLRNLLYYEEQFFREAVKEVSTTMKCAWLRGTVGVIMAAGLAGPVLFAEDGMKTLPTLLIKGEVVSLDTTDPAATLLKVKDRYGFETPIFLTPETKVTKGDTAVNASDLTAGAAVEEEYNFDVNTAKRHAVSVKVAAPAAAEASSAPVPAAAPSSAEPAAEAPEATPAPAASPEPMTEASPAAPAPQAGPAAPATTQ